MTQHDDTLYLALMRDEIRGVMGILERGSRDQFIAHDILPGAAAYHFMRLAERPLKVSPTFRADHPEIPWEDLADIRSRVEPELFREDAAAMWEIGTAEFPVIADALKGWEVFRLDDELSELFGRKVDVMHGQPVRYIRAQILAEARTIYVTGCEPPG